MKYLHYYKMLPKRGFHVEGAIYLDKYYIHNNIIIPHQNQIN